MIIFVYYISKILSINIFIVTDSPKKLNANKKETYNESRLKPMANADAQLAPQAKPVGM